VGKGKREGRGGANLEGEGENKYIKLN